MYGYEEKEILFFQFICFKLFYQTLFSATVVNGKIILKFCQFYFLPTDFILLFLLI